MKIKVNSSFGRSSVERREPRRVDSSRPIIITTNKIVYPTQSCFNSMICALLSSTQLSVPHVIFVFASNERNRINVVYQSMQTTRKKCARTHLCAATWLLVLYLSTSTVIIISNFIHVFRCIYYVAE